MLHAKDGRDWPKFLSSNTQDFIEVQALRKHIERPIGRFLSSNTQDFIEV